ncbi:MAG: hypothetical protein R3E39_21875 [Anaerolineae bacterium]
MEFLASTLRAIADQMGLKPPEKLAIQPGMRGVYRLTIRYHDRRARDVVATATRSGVEGARLEVVFRRLFEDQPLTFRMRQVDYEGLERGLEMVHFDKLDDQANIPSYGVDLWMWERAAGTFYKSVIFVPEQATGVYAELVQVARVRLAEAVREVEYD